MLYLDSYWATANFWRLPNADPECLRRVRDRRLRRLVRHAFEQVPFYRRLFNDHAVRPDDIRGGDDLQRLPIVKKKDLQRVPTSDLIARGTKTDHCIRRQTSGSSGRPLVLYRSQTEEWTLAAQRIRSEVAAGLRPRQLRAKITHDGWLQTSQLHRLGLFPFVHVPLDLQPRELLAKLTRIAAPVVESSLSSLEPMVRNADREELRALRMAVVFCGGETPSPALRALIEERCCCEVIDFYGAHEFNLLAWECRHCGRYHTCDDNVILEVLRDGRPAAPGQSGEVVATGLHSFSMPLLRYALEDVARAKARHPRILALVADTLTLPFRDRSFDTVASFSTLDHLATQEGTVEGLSQLHRIMRPGGRLLITLDNRANPKIWLRNSLPWRLVRTSRLVPYYVGPSLSPEGLVSSVRHLGFRVDKTSFILHCPRIAAVAASRLPMLRNGRQRSFQRLLAAFERLADFPTRQLTAHFVAVSARKAS